MKTFSCLFKRSHISGGLVKCFFPLQVYDNMKFIVSVKKNRLVYDKRGLTGDIYI